MDRTTIPSTQVDVRTTAIFGTKVNKVNELMALPATRAITMRLGDDRLELEADFQCWAAQVQKRGEAHVEDERCTRCRDLSGKQVFDTCVNIFGTACASCEYRRVKCTLGPLARGHFSNLSIDHRGMLYTGCGDSDDPEFPHYKNVHHLGASYRYPDIVTSWKVWQELAPLRTSSQVPKYLPWAVIACVILNDYSCKHLLKARFTHCRSANRTSLLYCCQRGWDREEIKDWKSCSPSRKVIKSDITSLFHWYSNNDEVATLHLAVMAPTRLLDQYEKCFEAKRLADQAVLLAVGNDLCLLPAGASSRLDSLTPHQLEAQLAEQRIIETLLSVIDAGEYKLWGHEFDSMMSGNYPAEPKLIFM